MQPFDLQRMFFGDEPLFFLLEIAFRTVFLYLFTLGMLRLVGQRGMERLSSFDFAIVIAMGSAVGDPMFYPDVPLIHGMIVVTGILLVERALGYITKVSRQAEHIVEGKTQEVVKDGQVNLDFLKDSLHSQNELFLKLRLEGARTLGEVEAAYLELDGEYSVFLYPPEKARPGLPLIPPWDIAPPRKLKAGDLAPRDGYYGCNPCGDTIELSAGDALPACARCRVDDQTWVEAALYETTTKAKK